LECGYFWEIFTEFLDHENYWYHQEVGFAKKWSHFIGLDSFEFLENFYIPCFGDRSNEIQ
jgi:hypothetical protein